MNVPVHDEGWESTEGWEANWKRHYPGRISGHQAQAERDAHEAGPAERAAKRAAALANADELDELAGCLADEVLTDPVTLVDRALRVIRRIASDIRVRETP